MANSLGRNLKAGDKVVLTNGMTVEVEEGFGMYTFTAGTALFVKTANGMRMRVEGYDINAEATEKL